jgi:peptide/nickel transport system ATP-binding protein
MMALIEVRDLRVEFPTPAGVVAAVDGVGFDVDAGETVGIVGESGSGKSVTALSMMHLIDPPGRVAGGSIRFHGEDLLGRGERAMLDVRGKRIGMIFQEPFASLNPIATVGTQLREAVQADVYDAWRRGPVPGLAHTVGRWLHPGSRRRQDREGAARGAGLLRSVRLPDAEEAFRKYPHMLSGGMLQRVMIAVAMASRPALLIADEPTTALDVTIQAQILEILRERKAQSGSSMVLITHDLGLIAEMCDRVVVMYAGRVMESAPTAALFAQPRHPYTRGLLASMPSVHRPVGMLAAMDGAVPSMVGINPAQCHFADRCPLATELCRTRRPPVVDMGGGRTVACHAFSDEGMRAAGAGRRDPWSLATAPNGRHHPPRAGERDEAGPILELRGLRKEFAPRGRLRVTSNRAVRAVDGVSLEVRRGETLALVGESGCGKTTLAELILMLQEPTAGEVVLDGVPVGSAAGRRRSGLRRRVQIVFQNPRSSLNPRLRIEQILREPWQSQGRRPARGEVPRLLATVGLDGAVARRYPHELSGGQAQRVAVARALALRPDVIVLDEPTSALDVSVQAQVLNLLRALQAEMDLTFLFISHDLRVVRNVADRVGVMYLGKLVELGPTAELYQAPAHPYTRALIEAIPDADPSAVRERLVLAGDVPSPTRVPSGCRFRTRCPMAAAICAEKEPELREVRPGYKAACHFAVADTDTERR